MTTEAPAATAPAPEAAPDAGVEKQWGDLTASIESDTSDDDASLEAAPDVTAPAAPAAPAVPPPAEVTPPASVPPAPAAVAPVAPAAPVAQPPAAPAPVQAAPVAPAAPAAPTAPAPTPQPSTTPDFTAMRNQAMESLTQRYAMSDEDAATLIASPEKIVPQTLARMHLEIFDQVVSAVMPMIGQQVMDIQRRQTAGKELEGQFFTKWPKLKGHEADIKRVATVYRQMHPQAGVEESINAIGALVMYEKGMAMEVPPIVPTPPPAVPAFSPALTRGTPPVPPPAPNANPFTAMAEEFRQEDM